MATAEQREIIGDHNVVKGTDYHFVYTLWRLLYQPAQLAFYAGNDLLDRPLQRRPPLALEKTRTHGIEIEALLQAREPGHDIWIQLKSTTTSWTLNRMLDDTLLYNFIFNEFRSRQDGRTPHFELVTQAEIKGEEISAFLQNSADPRFAGPRKKLNSIIDEVVQQLKRTQNGPPEPDVTTIEAIAAKILLELCASPLRRVDILVAQIITALTEYTGNAVAAHQLANLLLGALLRDAAATPAQALFYDLAWLNKQAGAKISSRGLFDRNPVTACIELTKQALPRAWDEGRLAVPRPLLENALQQFMDAPEPVFILVGASNVGKSWAIARWCLQVPSGQVRLLIPGRELDHIQTNRPLLTLIAERLAPFIATQRTPEQVLAQLQAATGTGQCVVMLDDLRPPDANLPVYRQDLARLVEEARQHSIKLVLTCTAATWELNNLGTEIKSADIFATQIQLHELRNQKQELRKNRAERAAHRQRPNSVNEDESQEQEQTLLAGMGPSRRLYSFAQDNLTAAELRAIVHIQLPVPQTEEIAAHLLEPAFALLRNPYILTRYLAQYAKTLASNPRAEPIPVEVDTLLDRRIQETLEASAVAVAVGYRDVRRAFDILVDRLWETRSRQPEGVSYGEAEGCFNSILGTRGSTVLEELRRQGLLTADGAIGVGEPLVIARLFALRLLPGLDKATTRERTLWELQPATDTDVVVALLRVIGHTTSLGITAITCAEMLLSQEENWLAAVCEGLAQGAAGDYRVLAYLTALLRAERDVLVIPEICDALGELAVRSRRAWKWVAGMYLTRRATVRLNGARALGTTIEYAPKRVEGAIRLRMMKARRITEREPQCAYLREVLDPLLGVVEIDAAHAAERLIDMYSAQFLHLDELVAGRPMAEEEMRLIEDVDEVRGRIALILGVEQLDQLQAELASTDGLARYRAAAALRFVAFARPDRIRDALFAAIAQEDDDKVLNRILWDVFEPGVSAPEAFLTAIEASRVVNWQVPSGAAGAVLGLLGDFYELLPPQERRRAIALLPVRLTAYPAWARAFLSEILAWAWWRAAEDDNLEARTQLAHLITPDLVGVPQQFRIFAIRGAVVAQLGLICANTLHATELRGAHFPYPHSDHQFLTIDLSDFVRQHSEHIVRDMQCGRLQRLLSLCVREEQRVHSDLRQQLLYQGRHLCARYCLKILQALVPSSGDPTPILAAIPEGEQDLHAVYELFVKEGRIDPAIVDRVRALCPIEQGGTHEMILERELCRYHLARLDYGPDIAIDTQGRVHQFLRGGVDGATYLAHLVAAQPDKTLELLERNIQDVHDFGLLYYTEETAHTWQLLLLARVYARMFSRRVIQPSEAWELCQQVLIAIEGLTSSPLTEEYYKVYHTIATWLKGTRGSVSMLVPREDSPIGRSHQTALHLLQNAGAAGLAINATWINNALYAERAWWEADEHLKAGRLSYPSIGYYLMYIFPAVRLAGVALGQIAGVADPGCQLMEERICAHRLYKEHQSILEPLQGDSEEWHQEQLQNACMAFDAQLRITPNDERLWGWKGLALLLAGEIEQSESALQQCLAYSWCVGATRGQALYNLACTYARLGAEDSCRTMLKEALMEEPSHKKQLSSDRDFDSIRGRMWFRQMVEEDHP